ncbi:hypothetical protein MAM1_0003d00400 [Mucor ambiguus]|uniref:Uncharacterized protein n=1 Tax=Mucor ambiguus TaxID=91626 RepID=A0A0C9MDD8_9FUNG|nr:hypothetical protein MAM1_0003d00400 [Mucor ambiguus]
MSRRPLSTIIKDWSKKSIRENRKTPSQIRKLIKENPDALEAKLYTNPYELLLRFGLAWHLETNRNWAFPTLRKTTGFGYYVNLKKEILQVLQKGAYQATFRGAATYRSDMVEHVQDVLFQQTYTEFSKHPIQMYDTLEPITDKQWKSNGSAEYQCILSFDATQTTLCELDHHTQTQQHVPCYNMHRIWSPENMDHLKSQLNLPKNASVALGVPKSIETIQLATDLWHCRQFINQPS